MDDNQFWLAIWRTVAAAFCVLIVSIGSCTSYQTHKVGEVIKGGADPLRARCGLLGSDERSGVCSMLAAQAEKKETP